MGINYESHITQECPNKSNDPDCANRGGLHPVNIRICPKAPRKSLNRPNFQPNNTPLLIDKDFQAVNAAKTDNLKHSN